MLSLKGTVSHAAYVSSGKALAIDRANDSMRRGIRFVPKAPRPEPEAKAEPIKLGHVDKANGRHYGLRVMMTPEHPMWEKLSPQAQDNCLKSVGKTVEVFKNQTP